MCKRAILSFLVISWCFIGSAWAAPARTHAIVLVVDGKDAAVGREISAIPMNGVSFESPDELLATIATQGVAGSLSENLSNARTRLPTLVAVRKAVQRLGVAGVLVVQTQRGRGGVRQLHVVLLIATQTQPMTEEDIVLSRSERVAPRIEPLLTASFQELSPTRESGQESADEPRVALAAASNSRANRGRAPTATRSASENDRAEGTAEKAREGTEGAAKDENEASASPKDRDVASTPRPPLDVSNAKVVTEISVGVASRRFEYSDAVAGGLRDHLARAIAVYSLGAELYPAAGSGLPFAKDIGVVGRYSGSLSVDSRTSDGAVSARSTFQRYAIGVRGRLRLSDAKSSPLLGVEGTYGSWSFAFDSVDPLVALPLSVDYKYVRAGADVRVPIGRFGVFAGGGYMNVLSAGSYSDRFPRATIGGVDVSGGAWFALASFIDLRAAVMYTRIFSSAHADLDGPYVAGGALDQYASFNLGASAIF